MDRRDGARVGPVRVASLVAVLLEFRRVHRLIPLQPLLRLPPPQMD